MQNVKTGKLSHEHNLMMQRGPKGETPFASQRPPPPVINLRCYDVLGGAPGISCECECECRPRMLAVTMVRIKPDMVFSDVLEALEMAYGQKTLFEVRVCIMHTYAYTCTYACTYTCKYTYTYKYTFK